MFMPYSSLASRQKDYTLHMHLSVIRLNNDKVAVTDFLSKDYCLPEARDIVTQPMKSVSFVPKTIPGSTRLFPEPPQSPIAFR